MLGLR
jgi:hypothetical protein